VTDEELYAEKKAERRRANPDLDIDGE